MNTTVENLINARASHARFEEKRRFFAAGRTRSYDFRREQLRALMRTIHRHEDDILAALYQDLGKPALEAYTSEIALVQEEIHYTLKRLKRWMKPRRVSTSLVHFPSTSRVIPEPKGVALIIGPWNYPFQLLMAPLVGAIAAGNCAVLKPSEETPHTALLIEKIIGETFSEDYVSVVQGEGAQVVPELMDAYRFDHVFFTGSVPVGRIIAQQAAPSLTPVTLELGGKSPAIVDHTADLRVTARRLMWTKCFNAGQTCVSPDYLLVHQAVKENLLVELKQALLDFYGPSITPNTVDYGRIVNEKRFDTLVQYLEHGIVRMGGQTDRKRLFMAPTVLDDVAMDSPVMREEIFGPILPVLTYQTNEEARGIIEQNPFPLSLYVFTKDSDVERYFTENIQFGGGAVNNALVHLSNPNLPFGGIGTSGTGNYHGKRSFDAFSHEKSIMKTRFFFDAPIKYPPYSKQKLTWVKRLL